MHQRSPRRGRQPQFHHLRIIWLARTTTYVAHLTQPNRRKGQQGAGCGRSVPPWLYHESGLSPPKSGPEPQDRSEPISSRPSPPSSPLPSALAAAKPQQHRSSEGRLAHRIDVLVWDALTDLADAADAAAAALLRRDWNAGTRPQASLGRRGPFVPEGELGD